jgi:hypothetical protein
MKHAALALTCLLVLACASSAPTTPQVGKVKIAEPDIEFLQLIGPADLNYPAGDMEVQYGMRIANRSTDAITLRRVEMSTVGGGGPYMLRSQTYYFKTVVGPDQYNDVAWWARAVARGNAFAVDANAPVSVRAIAYFETPHGMIRKVLMRNFTQFGGAVEGR